MIFSTRIKTRVYLSNVRVYEFGCLREGMESIQVLDGADEIDKHTVLEIGLLHFWKAYIIDSVMKIVRLGCIVYLPELLVGLSECLQL